MYMAKGFVPVLNMPFQKTVVSDWAIFMLAFVVLPRKPFHYAPAVPIEASSRGIVSRNRSHVSKPITTGPSPYNFVT